MSKYTDRFVWNLKNLFNKKLNPYVLNGEDDLEPKKRTAIEDLFHSFKNLWAHTEEKKK
jgi:hypothetical protein